MKDDKQRIIIRRVQSHGGGGHGGGGWKIAYADFMTAMMAFFLVMWLLASASPKQLKGVAEHFRMPLKVAVNGGPKSSDASSVIPGGGTDVRFKDGEVKQAEGDAEADAKAMEQMKERLEKAIENSPVFNQFKSQLLVDITTEGLRLQIVDSEKRAMFDSAKAQVVPHMGVILRELAPVLNNWPNKVTLSGHTDSAPYNGGHKAYSNWELSADRANASRRELAAGGLAPAKVLRVMGLADSMHLDKENPRSSMNRRISIIVLNSETQQRIERENSGDAKVLPAIGLPSPGAPPPGPAMPAPPTPPIIHPTGAAPTR